MFARVLIATAQPNTRDEIVQVIRDSVLPVAKQQPGFKGYFALTDASTGKGITVSLWETEANLRAGEASGYVREQLAKVARFFTSAPVQEIYEVAFQDMQQGKTSQYARVLTAATQPGKMSELIQIANDSVLPAAKQQHGFNGMLLLADHTTNKGISITLWETEADMKASETSGYLREQLAKLANVFSTQVVREAFEVGVQG